MGVNQRKDRRGREKVYVDKTWPDGKRFTRVVPNRTIGKKLLARIEESIAMETWRAFRQELNRRNDDPVRGSVNKCVNRHQAAFSWVTGLTGTPLTYWAPW